MGDPVAKQPPALQAKPVEGLSIYKGSAMPEDIRVRYVEEPRWPVTVCVLTCLAVLALALWGGLSALRERTEQEVRTVINPKVVLVEAGRVCEGCGKGADTGEKYLFLEVFLDATNEGKGSTSFNRLELCGPCARELLTKAIEEIGAQVNKQEGRDGD